MKIPSDDLSRRTFLARSASRGLGLSIAGSATNWFAAHRASASGLPGKKAKHIIYLYMAGGMSHLDTLDPKPDAPLTVRGPLETISTRVPGLRLGQYLSRTSKHAEKLCLVRSMTSTQGAHEPGKYFVHTGHTRLPSLTHPALGAWMMKLSPEEAATLPRNLTIHAGNDHPGAGFLEPQYAPLPIGDAEKGLPFARSHRSDRQDALTQQMALRKQLDAEFNAEFSPGYRKLRAYDQVFDSAVSLMKSEDLKAFDLSLEPPETRALYGSDRFGKGVLLARRLVQHGVRFVEVQLGGFDWHSDNFTQAAEKLPILDQALSALLEDLTRTGLIEETLVVLATEFGRSPEIDADAGRNHHPKAFSFLLAGAGVKGGHVHGATDATGDAVVSEKTTIPDFNATIAAAAGIPHNQQVWSPSKRPFTIGGRNGRPISAILS